jgi:hypothetical protein
VSALLDLDEIEAFDGTPLACFRGVDSLGIHILHFSFSLVKVRNRHTPGLLSIRPCALMQGQTSRFVCFFWYLWCAWLETGLICPRPGDSNRA